MKRLLFLGAHTDDELSSAGTLSKFSGFGYEIFLAVFSFCEESSVQLGYPRDILIDEFECSMKVLEIKEDHLFKARYPVRNFPQYRQNILDDLIKIKKIVKPSIVIMPSLRDVHQDHCVVAREGKRAFPNITILCYETPKSPLSSKHLCYVKLESAHIKKKGAYIDCYKSQKVRNGMTRARAFLMMRFRGAQAGYESAEVFEVLGLHL